MKKRVTLKADLQHGTFYWVTNVEAATEEEAIVAAENLFMNELERTGEWEFTDFDVSE